MFVFRLLALGTLFFLGCKSTNPTPGPVVLSETEAVSPSKLYDDIDTLLAKYLSDGLVDYKGLQQEVLLDSVVKRIAVFSTDSLANLNDTLAFWSNAYNMHVMKGVIEYLNISRVDANAFAFFDGYKVKVSGEELSLNQLEQKFKDLRPVDPRFHFSLNCAAVSCPELKPTAFRGTTWDADLLKLGQDFLTDRTRNVITKDKITLSTIFHWNEHEFREVGDENTAKALLVYATEDEHKELLATLNNDFFKNSGNFAYDWTLNEQK